MPPDGQLDAMLASFPMAPRAVIEALTADAVEWLEQAGDPVTESAVRRLVAEALELRLRLRRL